MKKWTYIIGLMAIGIVIFNNAVQTAEVIKLNSDYMIGLLVAVIVSMGYGAINLK